MKTITKPRRSGGGNAVLLYNHERWVCWCGCNINEPSFGDWVCVDGTLLDCSLPGPGCAECGC